MFAKPEINPALPSPFALLTRQSSISRSVWIIALGLVIMSVAILGSATMQMLGVQRLNDSLEEVAGLDARARRLEFVIVEFQDNADNLIASGNAGKDADARQLKLYELVNRIGASGAELTTELPEARRLFNPFEAERLAASAANIAVNVTPSAAAQDRAEAQAFVKSQIDKISTQAHALSDFTRIAHQNSQALVTTAISQAFLIILLVGALNLLGGIGLIRYLIRYFARPARQIAETTQALSEGNLDVAVPRMKLKELHQIGVALERFRETAQVERELAYRDVASGMPNRRAFLRDLRVCVTGNAPDHILCFVDIDRFKDVNDIYGHDAGDTLVRSIADRLITCFPNAGVYRIGGDEFALIHRLGKNEAPTDPGEAIVFTMREAFVVGESRLMSSCSVGMAIVRSGDDPDVLIGQADVALYHVKENGRDGFALYNASMLARDERARRIEHDLPMAIKSDELRLVYQPILATSHGEPHQVEALLRWNHPDLHIIPPEEFVAIAERSGKMIELGDWVLDRAFADMRLWPEMRVAINLSAVQLRAPDFAQRVLQLATKHGISPHLVELEITESVAIENSEWVQLTLGLLRSYGFRIALDDFGTGYSSLAFIKTYPLDRIKLDRVLLQGFGEDEAAAAVLDAAVAIGSRLKLEVVAEGVEDASQANAMTLLGCTHLQGYFFSEPLEADQVAPYFKPEVEERPYKVRAA
jgi:diguanylate cyclase (GGDEF)-like protein